MGSTVKKIEEKGGLLPSRVTAIVSRNGRLTLTFEEILGILTAMVFLDLPLDILPEIFNHIVKPQHLASLCLVNNSFRTFAVCKLYERVFIYSWHKEGKTKACARSLALNTILPRLTGYKTLLYAFPLSISSSPRASPW